METKNLINFPTLLVIILIGGLSFLVPTDANSNIDPEEEYSFVCCNAPECPGDNECSGEGKFTCCYD